jgi:hypothetical protein
MRRSKRLANQSSNGIVIEAEEGAMIVQEWALTDPGESPQTTKRRRHAQKLQASSLINFDSSTKTDVVKERGVSIRWLSALASLCMQSDLDPSITTSDMVNVYLKAVLKGRTSKGGSTLFDALPTRFAGVPTHYIAHAWDAPFFELVAQIEQKLSGSPTYATSPTSVISPDPTASPFARVSEAIDVFVWIDFVAIPQTQASLDASASIISVKEIIASFPGGVLLVVDSELKVLTRSWCLLEAFYGAYLFSHGGLQMAFPAHMDVNLAWDLDQSANNVDIVNRGECSLDHDKVWIVSEVKKQIGVKRTNDHLRESIKRVARSTLRWGSIESLAVYCALLIRGGEFSILHCTLSSNPDLAVDKDLLIEIMGIFKVYDSDNSGELDEEEFITVLGLAGFSPSEAKKIFDEVNTDGGDGVGLKEFEEWWVSSQKQQWKAIQSNQAEMTPQTLTILVNSLISLLERTPGLKTYVRFFKGWLGKLSDPITAATMFPNGKLAPPMINGDWKSVCDQVSWKLTNNESKGVCDLLWRFLLVNADACSINIEALAPKKKEEMTQRDVYLLLHAQLLQLTEILGLHPSRWRQKDYFSRAAEDIRVKANCCDVELPDLSKKKKMMTGAKNKTWFSFGLISNMVHLKYGDEQTISRRLIKEAGAALGRWMASNRRSQAGNKHSDVNDLSRNYLTHVESEMDEYGASSLGGSSSLGGGSIGKDSYGASMKGGSGGTHSFSAMMGGGYKDRSEMSPSPTRGIRKGISFLPDINGRSPSPSIPPVQGSGASEPGRSMRKISSHANGSVMRVALPEVEQIKRSRSVTSPTRIDRN